MNIADPKYLEYLRDLPSSYLCDLMADGEGGDIESIYWVLQERGFSREEIDQKLQRRRNSILPRPYKLWAAARWLTLFNTLIIIYFNLTGLYRLMQGEHTFKGPLLFLAVGCILCGFVVGYKLTTYLYQGSRSLLYCGFPVPVGFVELQTGEETVRAKTPMIMRIAMNALVGVNLTLFPLIFIYIMMG
jgi:hypothetical protein